MNRADRITFILVSMVIACILLALLLTMRAMHTAQPFNGVTPQPIPYPSVAP